jgi:hypothetical protein
MSVSWVFGWMIFMVICHRRRRLVIRSSPSFDLLLSIFHDSLLLIFSHQITVMPFIQPPMFVNRNVLLSKFHENNVGSSYRSPQKACVNLVKKDPGVCQHLSGKSSLQNSVVCQWSVGPANEAVVTVPSRLPMS